MRFFSNDARETTDDQAPDDERTERVQSDPVAVPNQRPGSPWSDTPNDETGVNSDGTVVDDTARPSDPDATTTFSTAEQPTQRWDNNQTPTGNTYAGSTAAGSDALTRDERTDEVDSPAEAGTETETDKADTDPIDLPLDDRSNTDSATLKDEGDFEDPKAVDPVTEEPLDSDSPRSDKPDVSAASSGTDSDVLKDDGDFNDPQAVDPVTDDPIVDDSSPATPAAAVVDSTPADETPEPAVVAVPVPVGAAATAAPAKGDTFFAEADAQSFQQRWRDVQLHFVDDPKDAAADAAKLVDEALDKLTASLKAQRDGLGSDSEDTEQLRVQLRAYRDILNRILSL